MKLVTKNHRVILDAALDRSVIRGTLTGPAGELRPFHGWLELNIALEAMLSDHGAQAADTVAGCPPHRKDES